MTTMIPVTTAPPTLFCYACGHRWLQRTQAPPHKCPNCQSQTWYNPNARHRKGRMYHAAHHPETPTLPGIVPGNTAPSEPAKGE